MFSSLDDTRTNRLATSARGVTNRKAHPMTDNEIATNFYKLPEVPVNPYDELLLWHALHRLEVAYWYDVDFDEGRTAHEFFTPDGVKIVGHNRFEGREEIRAFYKWRARRKLATAASQLGISGVRAVRHLITNLYVASSSERCATARGIVIFYGGKSKLQSSSPMVADLINECVLNEDNVWRFKSHTLRPIFMSYETPPAMEIDPNFLRLGVEHTHINLNEHAHRREFIRGRIMAKNEKMSRQISRYSPKPRDSIFCFLDDRTEE
jgi:hypothetical protein